MYLRQLAGGDLGVSIYTGQPVLDDILERFPATIELTLVSIGVATLLGIPLGVLSALKRNSWLDHSLRTFTTAGFALTGFWLGIMLQLLLSMDLDLLPLGGRIDVPEPRHLTGLFILDSILTLNGTALLSSLKHIALPALTLIYPAFATITRFTRSGVLDVIQRDFILYEKAMGLPRLLILFKYLLRNAVTSTVTYWPWFARTVAAETRSVKQATFVEASEALGMRPMRIVFYHVLPNVLSPIIARSTIGMGFTILTAAALGFLGVGAQPPAPEWGSMIAEARLYFPDAWWYATSPGLAIFFVVMGFNLLGDGLRDILDPRLRRSRG